MNKFSESSLKNGLKIITAEVAGSGVVTITVLIRAGSRFEKAGERGIAHIFEHMLWRGTKNRPSLLDIPLIVDRAGAAYNAETTIETIRTFVQVAKEEAEKMTELLSDIIKNPLFDEKILENEKKVILQEMKQFKDNRERRMWMETVNAVFKGHPLANYPIGTEEDVTAATAEKLREYYKRFFVANNMAIVFSGGIDHEKAVLLGEKYFSDISIGVVEDNRQSFIEKAGEITINFPGSQTSLNVCFSDRNISEKDARILDLVANYLGYKETSLLYQELRGKRGLVYGVKVYLVQYKDASIFCINTSTVNADEVQKIILDKLFNFEKYFTPEVLNEYKLQLKNIVTRSLDGESALNGYFSRGWIYYDKLITPEESLRLMDEIKYEEVIEIIKKTFRKDNLFIIKLKAD